MKKLTVLLLATAMVVPAAAANAKAADHSRTHVTRTVVKDAPGPGNARVVKRTTVTKTTRAAPPRFAVGQRFDRGRAVSYHVVDYRVHRAKLRPAPRGYYWAHSGHDAFLVRASTGIIASVVTGIFR